MEAGPRARRIDEMVTMLDMKSFAGVRTDKLSTGMKQENGGESRAMAAQSSDTDASGLSLLRAWTVPTARAIETAIVEAKKGNKCLCCTRLM